MADLGEQIDSLSANKVKSEKDKSNMELDLRDARCDLEDAVKGKAELDKTGKLLQGNIVDANTRLDEMARALNEAESSKKRLQVENEDRSALLTKYKMMATDLENFREKLENENARKSDALKALSKAQAEIQLWKSRFETEGMGRVEELEAARNKLQAKIVESEELVDVLTTKVANAEKSKTRMNSELDDLAMEYERVHAAALITEKRGKNFDKVLGEWQSKAADVSAEVAAPSTTWTSRGAAWSRRRRSSRELWRRQRAPSSRRRTRSSAPSLNLDRSSRRLTGVWLKRRKSSTTPGRTTLAPWSPCLPPWRLSRRPRVRPSVSRRLWRERSTSLRSVLTMPTRPTQRDLSLSSATRASLRRPSSCTRTRLAPAPKSWSRSASLSARLPPSPASLRSPRP